jgi:AcrR family transcriptional regulator
VRRLTREESHARTREKLIAAGRAEIAAKGAVAASVRSISEAAGFSQGAFYSCFESKEELLLYLLHEGYGSVLNRLAAVPVRIEARLQDAKDAKATDIVVEEMDAFLASTRPGSTFASLAIELQIYANHKAGSVKAYELARSEFHAAVGQVMSRVFDFLPHRPAIDPMHLTISLMATGVGYWTMGASISIEERRHILSTFFRGAIGAKPRA